MYAERYGPQGYNRGSLSLSVGIVGGLLAVAFLASPVAKQFVPEHILHVYPVDPVDPPPPPDPVPPKVQPKTQQQHVDTPEVLVPTDPPIINEYPPAPPLPPAPPIGDTFGMGGGTVPIKPPPPVLTGATVDARYAGELQPPYPAAAERAGLEGVVTLRVLIGVDGRVKQVERLAAASDDFWRVTERQALSRWRFKAATRDGVPVETWKTMTVRFRLPE